MAFASGIGACIPVSVHEAQSILDGLDKDVIEVDNRKTKFMVYGRLGADLIHAADHCRAGVSLVSLHSTGRVGFDVRWRGGVSLEGLGVCRRGGEVGAKHWCFFSFTYKVIWLSEYTLFREEIHVWK